MASNIKEKNLIYSFDEYTSMPYSSEKHINYSSENSYVNSTSLNNTYQQLVDNDLYIAQQLLSKKDYKIGPTALDKLNPDQHIKDMANGEKFFTNEDGVKVYKKVEKALKDSIHKAENSQFSGGVVHVFKALNGKLLVCTASKTYLVDASQIESSNGASIGSVVEVKGPSNKSIALEQCCGNAVLQLFAGTCDEKKGIYKIASDGSAFTLEKELPISSLVPSIAYRQKDNILLFAVNVPSESSTLYRCKLLMDGSIDLESLNSIYYLDEEFDNRKICYVLFADNLDGKYSLNKTIVLFMDDGSIECSTLGSSLDVRQQRIIGDFTVYDQKRISGRDWYATSNGLMKKSGTSIVKVKPTATSSPTRNIAFKDDYVWTGHANGKIYKSTADDSIELSTVGTDRAISSLQFANGIPFAATSKSLNYLLNGSIKELKHGTESLSCTSMVEHYYDDGTSSHDDLYVACKTSSGNYLAVVSVAQPIPYESDAIASTMSAVYPTSGPYAAESTQFFKHNVGNSTHIYSLVKNGDNVALTDLTDRNKTRVGSWSSSYKFHGTVWTDTRVAIFMDDQCKVYTSLDMSNPQSLEYTFKNSFKEAIGIDEGQDIDWEVVDGDFIDASHMVALVKFGDGSQKLLHILLNDEVYGLCINDSRYDIIGLGKASTSLVLSAGTYYALSAASSGTVGHIRNFGTGYNIDPYELDGTLAETDIDLTSVIKISDQQQRINPGLECVYHYTDVGYQTNDGTSLTASDVYAFRRLDFISQNDNSTSLSVLSSIAFATAEGIDLSASRLISLGSQEIADIQFAPYYTDMSANSCAVIRRNDSSNSLKALIGFAKGSSYATYFTDKVFADVNILTSGANLKEQSIDTGVVDFSVAEVVGNNSMSSPTRRITVIYSTSNAVKKAVLDCSTTGTTASSIGVSMTTTSLMSGTSSAANNFAQLNASTTFFSIGSALYKTDGNTVAEVPIAFDSTIKSIAVNFSQLPSNDVDDYNNITTDLPQLIELESIDITSLSDSKLSPRRYTADRIAVLEVVTQKAIYELNAASTSITVKKKYEFDLASSTITDVFFATVTPYSMVNLLFASQTTKDFSGNLILAVDSTQLKTFIGNTLFRCLNNAGGTYFGIANSTSLASLAEDNDGNIWLQRTSSPATLSAWHLHSNALVDVGQQAGLRDSYRVVLGNGNAASMKLYYQETGQLSCWTGPSPQTNVELAPTSQVYSASYNPLDSKHPYFGVKIGSSMQVQTFTYEMYYREQNLLGFAAFTPMGSLGQQLALIDGSSDIIVKTDAASQNTLQYNYSAQSFEPIGHFEQVSFPNNIHDSQSIVVVYGTSPIKQLSCTTSIYDEFAFLPMSEDSAIGKLVSLSSFVPTCMSYINEQYCLFGTARVGASTKAIEIDFAGTVVSGLNFYKSQSTIDGKAVGAVQTSKNNYIVTTDSSVSKYTFSLDGSTLNDSCYSVLDGTFCCAPQKFYYQNQPIYTVAKDSEILSSFSGFLWNSILEFDNPTNSLSCYLQYSQHVLFAGKSTYRKSGNGLYFTSYSYEIVDDTPEFTAESAVAAYEQKEDEIALSIDQTIDSHVASMHGGTSPIKLLNEYMPIDFPLSSVDFIEDASAPASIQNDYIERVFTGDSSTGEIAARSSNSAMPNGRWKDIDLNYIVKQWKSGIMEFFIYLPTTYTYYIPHIDGAGYCAANGDTVQVNGYAVSPNLAENATHIQIDILSTCFFIDDIYENAIKGNSLPLKIYKDSTYSDQEGVAASMYQSFVEPSIAKQTALETAFDNYTFDYYCFGSDAQAIHLVAWDSKKNFLKKYKTVVYHGVGGKTREFGQRDTVVQRILEGDPAKQMYWDIFFADGGIFLGWATSKSALLPDVDNYPQSKMLDYNSLEKSIIHLYAVWTFYSFGADDTQLVFEQNASNTYRVAQIKIDPNITFTDNPSLENRIIVKYD